MGQRIFIGTSIAIVLVFVHTSKAVLVSDIACSGGNVDCTVDHSECDGDQTSPKCKCSESYKEDINDGSTCVNSVITDNECTSSVARNTDCQIVDQNAKCSSGNCACTDDYFLSSDKTQCVRKTTTVTCTDGQHNVCTQVDENSKCQDNGGNCVCNEGFAGINFCTDVITDITCIPEDTTCQDLNAVCLTGSTTCVCKDDYFLISDKRQCAQKISTVGCTPDHETAGTSKCQGIDSNSECPANGDKCACKAGYKGTDSCAKVLTGPCEADGECTGRVENSECSASTCFCVAGYKEANNLCVVVLGETCSVASDCTGWVDNSVCSSEKICLCEANYIKDGVACRKAAVTEITCDAGDEDCTVDHTECDDAETSPKCKCSDGYKKDSTDGSTCVKILGGACEGNIDCTGPVANSVCSEKKCECVTNFIEESAVCKKALGQTCTDQDTCVSNAECDEECKCLSGFTNSNGFCAAESSATSVWMASSLLVTALLIYLPRFILW